MGVKIYSKTLQLQYLNIWFYSLKRQWKKCLCWIKNSELTWSNKRQEKLTHPKFQSFTLSHSHSQVKGKSIISVLFYTVWSFTYTVQPVSQSPIILVIKHFEEIHKTP